MGGLAQLGEHLLCKQGVVGSIPSTSTNIWFEVASRKFLVGFAYADNLRLTSYDISLIFKNLEEVKNTWLMHGESGAIYCAINKCVKNVWVLIVSS